VKAGGDRIAYERGILGKGWGACSFIRPLDDTTRHALLAEMLGKNASEMTWKPSQRESFQWEGEDVFLSELGKIVDVQESKLRETVEELADKGLLTEDEAVSARPRLQVEVLDQRGSQIPPLPEFKPSDPYTSVRFVER